MSDSPAPAIAAREPAPSAPAIPRAAGVVAKPHHRRFLAPLLAAVALAIVGLYLYVPGLYSVTTDDAYLDAHVVSIVPKVAAYVSALHVDDNQKVAAGQLLVELDARDFAVAVKSAAADMASAEANVANVVSRIDEQQAVIGQNEAAIAGDRSTLEFAQQQLDRYGSLAKTGFGTAERFEQAQSDIGERTAALNRDLAALAASRAHVAVLNTERQQAVATVERQKAAQAQADLNLSYTRISAPDAGTVANRTVEVGNFVQPGQVLFSLVPDRIYVTANFKETQLARVRPGQPAIVHVDAFPGSRLTGHVDSIQPGTGAQFALLPPENATGNFVKVVQRVPVKIILDASPDALRWIAPGMSVEAEVRIAEPPAFVAFLTGLFGGGTDLRPVSNPIN
jgi:membrane fusion protein (multidrug efflux system)